MRKSFWLHLLALPLSGLVLHAAAQPVNPPLAQPLAQDVWWIPGSLLPNRQPDGNTVVLQGPKGLIVFDTGRHPWHNAAILNFARGRQQPIVAIVNSHWHLDHVSGNPALKAAYPEARVYASDAIDEALTGFLKTSMESAAGYLSDAGVPAETKEDIRLDAATIANGQALRPDVVVGTSGQRTIAGRSLQAHLASHGPTAGDVWIYDPESRIAVVGDLVTLPAPFLDTACVKGWLAALEEIAALPFATVVPGHGHPMGRKDFDTYHAAFKAFITCAQSDQEAKSCASAWTGAVDSLIRSSGMNPRQGQGMATYYVAEVLRPHGGNSQACRARR